MINKCSTWSLFWDTIYFGRFSDVGKKIPGVTFLLHSVHGQIGYVKIESELEHVPYSLYSEEMFHISYRLTLLADDTSHSYFKS